MPGPHVYPGMPNGPLALPAAVGTPAPTFTLIEQLAAPDPSTPAIPRTMFIRVAMSGADCTVVNSATAPNFYVRADSGDAVLINDHAQPPNLTSPIFDKPGSIPVDFVGEGSVFLEDHNVFRLVITFAEGAGDHVWQLGIWNNDATAARQFTWVVAATLADTAQSWIDVVPAALLWNVPAGADETKSVTVSNRGTGTFLVRGVTPALPSGFELDLPGRINPNTSAPLDVSFTAPATPPAGGLLTATATFVVTPPDSTAGDGAGHNHRFGVRARVTLPNSWRQTAPMPTGRMRLGLACASIGKLYAVGGTMPGDSVFETLEEYDPATETWITRKPMPTARWALRLAALDGKLYAVGGRDVNAQGEFQFVTTVEAYDPATDTWATMAPLQFARCDFGLAAANGKLYAAGGLAAAGVDESLEILTSLEEYDPATNRWTTRAPMPIPRDMCGLVAAANGRLYAFGNSGVTFETAATVDEYDPQTNNWVTKASARVPRIHFEVAAATNGKIYAIGGEGADGVLGVVEEYDPATDVWTDKARMPTPRSWHGLAGAKNGKLYAVGGLAGELNELVEAAEEYSPAR